MKNGKKYLDKDEAWHYMIKGAAIGFGLAALLSIIADVLGWR